MTQNSGIRSILRSSSIIGGASVISILVGLFKFKVVALLLGPTGIGVIGFMNNIIGTASSIGGLGIATVGTREIAQAQGQAQETKLSEVRFAVLTGGFGLAALAVVAMLVLRRPLAGMFSQSHISETAMIWIGVATGLTIALGAQTALLNGFRRVADLARISVFGAVFGTLIGIAMIAWLGERGIIAFVVSAPLITLIVGQIYVARLPAPTRFEFKAPRLLAKWRTMAWLGTGLMATSLVGSAGPLLVRTYLERHLGSEGLGLFQASWMISMNYLSFVLAAMGTDFFPRVAGVIDDHERVNTLVNEQIHVALLLVAPLLVAMSALAPVIVNVLYSHRFLPAADILRWQIVGDLMKVVCWPLGIIVLASGRTLTMFLLEALGMIGFVVATIVLLPSLGILAPGFGFIALYALYFPAVYWRARSLTNFRLGTANMLIGGFLLLAVLVLAVTGQMAPVLTAFFGTLVAAIIAVGSTRQITVLAGVPFSPANLMNAVRRRR